ncbi:MAG: glutamine--fructose-6-phosphate transaminase (isomerizing) [Candidatus Omnitrophica bacterium]|nr:glutamine--fructose-6-phosphate transaminase (isomerizing) [Candidatus Omnitrophota bacterium]
MCGIVGYIGKRDAVPVLLKGLKTLEYRGYDSAGIAVLSGGKLSLRKRQGKLSVLDASLRSDPLQGLLGIGHTRWATHGLPNEKNAHPHLDCSGKISVVHNGIVENFGTLKTQLIQQGHTFRSQTDTEVISHLIECYDEGDLVQAVRRALKEIEGTYAIVVLHKNHPDQILGARKGSPLVVGVGGGEQFLASDVLAFFTYTKKVLYLDDGEIVTLRKNRIAIQNFRGKPVHRNFHRIEWNVSLAEKGGFPHYMLKEIHEQPQAIHRTLAGRLEEEKLSLSFEKKLSSSLLKRIRRVIFFSCGTAWHASLIGKYLFERVAQLPSEVDISSEFRYRHPIVAKDTLAIPISQSGETADTLASLREAKEKGAKVLSICNVVGSTIARESDTVLYTHAGPEIAVPSTKAYTSQLTALYLLSVYLGRLRGALGAKEERAYLKELASLPRRLEEVIKDRHIQEVARECGKRYHTAANFLFLGRGVNFPSALEGALKLKELSYIHAEGYGAGEMKHGPIALINEKLPVVCIAPRSETYDKMASNIQEVRARRGIILSVATKGDPAIAKYSDHVFYIPEVSELFSPILVVVPLQLLAYHLAIESGCNVDQPRNLAKSVTVE